MVLYNEHGCVPQLILEANGRMDTRTDGHTDGRMDITSNRDARTHLESNDNTAFNQEVRLLFRAEASMSSVTMSPGGRQDVSQMAKYATTMFSELNSSFPTVFGDFSLMLIDGHSD